VTSPYIQQGKLGIHDSLPTRRESLSGEAYSQTVILRTGVAMLLRECDYSGVRREAILGSSLARLHKACPTNQIFIVSHLLIS
jgi:hypothetical protein